MANPASESNDGALKLDFDRRPMLQFRGSVVTSDAGLLAYRELEEAFGLMAMAGEMLADARTGKNGRASKCRGRWPNWPRDPHSGCPRCRSLSVARVGSCRKAGKARTFMPDRQSSGESRLICPVRRLT